MHICVSCVSQTVRECALSLDGSLPMVVIRGRRAQHRAADITGKGQDKSYILSHRALGNAVTYSHISH